MEKKSEKVTFRNALLLHKRAVVDMQKYCPGIFLSITLYSTFKALSPYVTIFLTAKIINELAGLHRPEVLWPLVLITLGSAAVLHLLTGILLHRKQAMKSKYEMRKERIFSDKMLDMDYAEVDDTTTHDLLHQVKQNDQWTGWGLYQVFYVFESMVQAILGVAGAIALTVSLFTLPVPVTAGRMVALNHPGFLVGLIALLAIAAGVGPMCNNKGTAYWTGFAEEARLGNRIFGAFAFLSGDQKRGLDFRMYNQQIIARYYMGKDNSFGPRGSIARCAKGPMGLWMALGSCISVVLIGIVYVFVCLKAWAGAFGVGSVTQYVGAVTTLTENISLLIEATGRMKSNATFLQITYEFLDIPNNMYQGSLTTEKRADRQYDVEFRNVSFKYPGAESWALKNVSMKFKVGNRLAIVGENGSGKTTFIKLLCRLYDPQEGQILLNGIDIRKYNYRDYMGIFSVVFQDFQLLSQPLGENVAGSQEYDRERVQKALVDAGFGERLASLPDGLETELYKDFSEKGVDISGGEAQKIAIARALYKDAPFIILDEPTAALDPIAEAEIYSKFNDISGDKTAIYISHRLSSCKFCDEIMVFHSGAVVQQGTHEELLADENGKYYELWNAQAQYYTE